MSDSNDFTIIGLSKVNSSIVGPDVFPIKSFSFVISEVKQLFIFFGIGKTNCLFFGKTTVYFFW